MPFSFSTIKPRATQDPLKDINWEASKTGDTLKAGRQENSSTPKAEETNQNHDKVDLSPETKEKDKDEHQHDNPLMQWAHGLTKGWL